MWVELVVGGVVMCGDVGCGDVVFWCGGDVGVGRNCGGVFVVVL